MQLEINMPINAATINALTARFGLPVTRVSTSSSKTVDELRANFIADAAKAADIVRHNKTRPASKTQWLRKSAGAGWAITPRIGSHGVHIEGATLECECATEDDALSYLDAVSNLAKAGELDATFTAMLESFKAAGVKAAAARAAKKQA